MNYEPNKSNTINLEQFGGNRPFTIEELVSYMVTNKRDHFFRRLFALNAGQRNNTICFDAMAFIAATKDFQKRFDFSYDSGENLEGDITYVVTAGGNWIWKLKTTITWVSALPVAGGAFSFHTDIIETKNVTYRINAMTGTAMEVFMLENNLHNVSWETALQRDRENFK